VLILSEAGAEPSTGQGGASPRGQNGIGAEPQTEKMPLAKRRAATMMAVDDSKPRF